MLHAKLTCSETSQIWHTVGHEKGQIRILRLSDHGVTISILYVTLLYYL